MKHRGRFDKKGVLAISANGWGAEYEVTECKGYRVEGNVAIVDIRGPLVHHADWYWDNYEAIRERVEDAFTSSCQVVILKIDSPGGDVAGCFELAKDIRKMAVETRKKCIAYADGLAASAAYALACAASEIYLPPTASVGSIGTLYVTAEQTAYDAAQGFKFAVVTSGERKADGNPHVAFKDSTLAEFQSQVDTLAELFFAHVSELRPSLGVDQLRALQASVKIGSTAVQAGLADGVIAFKDLLATLAGGAPAGAVTEIAQMSKYEDAIATLRKCAEGDDEQAKKAKKMLRAEMAEDEEKKEEAKAEDGEKKDDDKKDDDKKEASASAKAEDDKKEPEASAVAALAASHQALVAEIRAEKEAREREQLLASRPDFAPEVRAVLETASLKTLRDAVKSFPKSKPQAKGQVGAAIAAQEVAPTRGADQGEAPSAHAHDLDVQMGLKAKLPEIRLEGTRLVLPVMTPDQAKAYATKKGSV